VSSGLAPPCCPLVAVPGLPWLEGTWGAAATRRSPSSRSPRLGPYLRGRGARAEPAGDGASGDDVPVSRHDHPPYGTPPWAGSRRSPWWPAGSGRRRCSPC
jgi:hypothetical protein